MWFVDYLISLFLWDGHDFDFLFFFPSPKTAKTCQPGQRMGLIFCQNCPAGYYSLGGTAAVNKWDNWNTVNNEIPFSTYCTITDLYGVERHYNDQPCG